MSIKPRRKICDEAAELTVSGTESEIWHYVYGTDYIGNLPEYKKLHHVGNCFAPCPYSSFSSVLRTRMLLGLSDTDPLPVKTSHIVDGVNHYMKLTQRGSVWGYECVCDTCTYYTTNNVRYFYV